MFGPITIPYGAKLLFNTVRLKPGITIDDVMKKEDGRWRFQAQFEVPMSLVSQARWTHEAALAGDFLEFARRQNPQYDAQVAKDKRIKARKGEGVPWVTAGENTPQGFKRPDKPATP